MSNIHLIVSVTWRWWNTKGESFAATRLSNCATQLKKSFSNSLLAVLLAMQTGETGLDLQNGVSNSPPPSDLLT